MDHLAISNINTHHSLPDSADCAHENRKRYPIFSPVGSVPFIPSFFPTKCLQESFKSSLLVLKASKTPISSVSFPIYPDRDFLLLDLIMFVKRKWK